MELVPMKIVQIDFRVGLHCYQDQDCIETTEINSKFSDITIEPEQILQARPMVVTPWTWPNNHCFIINLI